MTRALALPMAILAMLSGCSAPTPALPDGVTVSVFQTRFDGALRQLQLRVENGSAAPIRIEKASFESSRFTEAASFDRPQTVPAGSARDLTVALGSPACDAASAQDAVTLAFSLPDGSTGSTTIELGEAEIVTAINDKDCLDAAVASLALITPPPAAVWTPGARGPAQLDITVTPTGRPGILSIDSAGTTTLFSLVTASGEHVDSLTLDAEVTEASGPVLIRLRVEPSRCDPHAIAEDKQGTHFPLEVDTSEGRSGRIVIRVSDDVRSNLYDYVADYCAMAG